MEKTVVLSNKVYLKNILRSLIVCGVGFILSWLVYAVFFSSSNNESKLAGLAVFFINTLFFYAVIIENVFYFLLKKNRMKAFSIMLLLFFVIMILSGFSLQLEFFLELCSFFLVFAVLQILGFQKQGTIVEKQQKKERIGQSNLSKD